MQLNNKPRKEQFYKNKLTAFILKEISSFHYLVAMTANSHIRNQE